MTAAPAGSGGAGRSEHIAAAPGRRTRARIAAVQALYQLGATGAAPEDVVDEFQLHRLREAGPVDVSAGDPTGGPAVDRALFADIVRGACGDRDTLNRMIADSLAEDWSLERMDRVLVALLNAGAWELLGRDGTPARVVIAEYVDVARIFFDRREPAFVNGILDRLARIVRAGEFSADAAGPAA